MRALLAVSTADRISHTAIVLAGALCGILVFFVAIPLALSSPYPSPKDGEWIIHRSSLHVASAISLPFAADLPSGLEHHAIQHLVESRFIAGLRGRGVAVRAGGDRGA